MEGDVLVRIEGALVLLLIKLHYTRWERHLRYKGRNPVICVNCDKTIYNTVTAALLVYKKLIEQLIDYGFKMNPSVLLHCTGRLTWPKCSKLLIKLIYQKPYF